MRISLRSRLPSKFVAADRVTAGEGQSTSHPDALDVKRPRDGSDRDVTPFASVLRPGTESGPHPSPMGQSREIRHLTSLKLRHLMQQQVDAWSEQNRPGQPPVNLVWIVGL